MDSRIDRPASSTHAMFGHTEATRGRMRRLNLVMLLPPIVAVGALLVAVDSRNWWDAALLTLGLATTMLAIERWTAGDLARFAVPCVLVVAAVWLVGALVADAHTAFYGISVVGPVVIPEMARHRAAAAVGLVAFVAAVGAAKLATADDTSGVVIAYVLIPTGVTVMVTGLMFANHVFYRFIAESREREAELAVARERMRFASDLHDIQGHTLHVVKLKVALAEKLVRSDVDRAEEELGEIHALVGDTITQTKELAYAQRRLNLAAEMENAKNLFEAAGIRVHVDRAAEVDPAAGELLGQVLRETTTNILRHAQATEVRISLSRTGISIVNDGAPDEPLAELRGLATLRERLAGDGGDLTVEQKDGRFLTVASFPPGEDR